jgi:hypothetical protein
MTDEQTNNNSEKKPIYLASKMHTNESKENLFAKLHTYLSGGLENSEPLIFTSPLKDLIAHESSYHNRFNTNEKQQPTEIQKRIELTVTNGLGYRNDRSNAFTLISFDEFNEHVFNYKNEFLKMIYG